jgi:hypothetical protein
MRYIVNVSGGLTSYEALRRTIERYGVENTTAVFADTRTEDPDLYRFLDDIERLFDIEIVRLADGRTVFEIWMDTKAITVRTPGGGGSAQCSKILKKRQIDAWLKKQPSPYTLVFGMEWSEIKRMDRLIERYAPTPCWFPLAEKPYVEKCDIAEQLQSVGIELPALYRDGFLHNNCGGGCVLAGQGHFALLYKRRPETFAMWERAETEFREKYGKDVAILKDQRGPGPMKPLPLAQFRKLMEHGKRIAKDQWGGCGCFVNDDQMRLDLDDEEERL